MASPSSDDAASASQLAAMGVPLYGETRRPVANQNDCSPKFAIDDSAVDTRAPLNTEQDSARSPVLPKLLQLGDDAFEPGGMASAAFRGAVCLVKSGKGGLLVSFLRKGHAPHSSKLLASDITEEQEGGAAPTGSLVLENGVEGEPTKIQVPLSAVRAVTDPAESPDLTLTDMDRLLASSGLSSLKDSVVASPQLGGGDKEATPPAAPPEPPAPPESPATFARGIVHEWITAVLAKHPDEPAPVAAEAPAAAEAAPADVTMEEAPAEEPPPPAPEPVAGPTPRVAPTPSPSVVAAAKTLDDMSTAPSPQKEPEPVAADAPMAEAAEPASADVAGAPGAAPGDVLPADDEPLEEDDDEPDGAAAAAAPEQLHFSLLSPGDAARKQIAFDFLKPPDESTNALGKVQEAGRDGIIICAYSDPEKTQLVSSIAGKRILGDDIVDVELYGIRTLEQFYRTGIGTKVYETMVQFAEWQANLLTKGHYMLSLPMGDCHRTIEAVFFYIAMGWKAVYKHERVTTEWLQEQQKAGVSKFEHGDMQLLFPKMPVDPQRAARFGQLFQSMAAPPETPPPGGAADGDSDGDDSSDDGMTLGDIANAGKAAKNEDIMWKGDSYTCCDEYYLRQDPSISKRVFSQLRVGDMSVTLELKAAVDALDDADGVEMAPSSDVMKVLHKASEYAILCPADDKKHLSAFYVHCDRFGSGAYADYLAGLGREPASRQKRVARSASAASPSGAAGKKPMPQSALKKEPPRPKKLPAKSSPIAAAAKKPSDVAPPKKTISKMKCPPASMDLYYVKGQNTRIPAGQTWFGYEKKTKKWHPPIKGVHYDCAWGRRTLGCKKCRGKDDDNQPIGKPKGCAVKCQEEVEMYHQAEKEWCEVNGVDRLLTDDEEEEPEPPKKQPRTKAQVKNMGGLGKPRAAAAAAAAEPSDDEEEESGDDDGSADGDATYTPDGSAAAASGASMFDSLTVSEDDVSRFDQLAASLKREDYTLGPLLEKAKRAMSEQRVRDAEAQSEESEDDEPPPPKPKASKPKAQKPTRKSKSVSFKEPVAETEPEPAVPSVIDPPDKTAEEYITDIAAAASAKLNGSKELKKEWKELKKKDSSDTESRIPRMTIYAPLIVEAFKGCAPDVYRLSDDEFRKILNKMDSDWLVNSSQWGALKRMRGEWRKAQEDEPAQGGAAGAKRSADTQLGGAAKKAKAPAASAAAAAEPVEESEARGSCSALDDDDD